MRSISSRPRVPAVALATAFVSLGCGATSRVAEEPMARVVSCVALRYDEGPDWTQDRPAHVRAASGVAHVPGAIAIVQDDASFIALVDGDRVGAIALPPGPEGRRTFDDASGNKDHKLDLESLFVVGGEHGARLVALGSGNSAPRRRVVIVDVTTGAVELRDGEAFYEALRSIASLVGSSVNVEGIVVAADRVHVFQRGTETAAGAAVANAVVELERDAFLGWLDGREDGLEPIAVRWFALGAAGDTAYSFTDAAEVGGRVAFVAVAERTDDVTADGPVRGVRIGVLDEEGVRSTVLVDPGGAPSRRKFEGIAPMAGDPNGLLAVTDIDDPRAPAELCRLRVVGLWTADASAPRRALDLGGGPTHHVSRGRP